MLILFAPTLFAGHSNAQVDDICREFGAMPMLDAPKLRAPYVYGRITVKGVRPGTKPPKITVIFSDGGQPAVRQNVDTSGNYCFKRTSGDGILVVEVGGVEVVRKSIAAFGPAQQREDFEVLADPSPPPAPPGVVSAKFSHPQNEKTIELYKQAAEAERNKDTEKAIEFVKQIVSNDPADFIAWAKLGTLHFERSSFAEAETAFRKSLELRVDYTLVWINIGKMRIAQKQYEAAIEIFKHAVSLEPTSARAFQLLGEAYLQARKGTLAVEALSEAIKLDPIGMAECHLLLARLYDLAGAKPLASKEFKAFLAKVPDHPDKKKFEKYINDNPEQ